MCALRVYKLVTVFENFSETEAPVRTRFFRITSLQHTVTLPKCATPQICNTLQHTATHCNTVTQHTVSFVLAFSKLCGSKTRHRVWNLFAKKLWREKEMFDRAIPSYQRRPSSLKKREGNVRFPTNLHGDRRSARPTSR